MVIVRIGAVPVVAFLRLGDAVREQNARSARNALVDLGERWG